MMLQGVTTAKAEAIRYYENLRMQGIFTGLNGGIVCVVGGIAFLVSPKEIDGKGHYFKMIEDASGGVEAVNIFE